MPAEPLAELQRLAVSVGGDVSDLGSFASHYIEKLSSAYNMGFAVACVSLIVSYVIYVAFRKTFRHADVTAKQQAASGAAAQVELTPAQTKSRITALMLVFAVVIFFWMAFHQNGSTMTFFARDYTTSEATGLTRMSFDILNLVLVLVGIYGLVGFFQAEKGRGKLIGAAAVVAALGALYYRWTVTPDPVHILPQVFQQFNPFYVVALTPLSVALFSSLARKGKGAVGSAQDRNGHDHRRRGLPDPHRRVDGPHVARRGQGRRCQRYLRVAELADLDLPRADVRRACSSRRWAFRSSRRWRLPSTRA